MTAYNFMVNSIRRFVAVLLAAIFFCLSIKAKEIERPAPDLLTADQSLLRYAGNIHRFCHIFPQEKVYVQFDNTSYYTGETIWFKVFVVEASDLHRAPSGVVYVDLLSPSGVILKQEKLKIVAGQADGSFPLVDGATASARDRRKTVLPYPSGFYEIRAYTSHMLNFSEGAVFSRVLPVFEQPVAEGNYYGEHPVIREKKSSIEQYRPKPEKLKILNAEFFPEGGSMIIGLPCRVAFKLTGDNGLGVNASGLLNGDIALSTIHDGMGSFTFTPSTRENRATFSYGGRNFSFVLPPAERSGYSLRASSDSAVITVSVAHSPDIRHDTLGLTLTCRGEVMFFATIDNEQEMTVSIPTQGLPEGVCQLTLFDRKGTVYSRRQIYPIITDSEILPEITFTPDKENYGPYQKIHLDFNLSYGASRTPLHDRFCLSVRDAGSPEMALVNDLRTTLLLTSDLRGMVYQPEYYFESDDAGHREALDLLMLVQGWERYDWQTMATVRPYKEVHRMEYGLGLNGWVLTTWLRKPKERMEVHGTVVPYKRRVNTERFVYNTGEDGYFGFNVSDFNQVARMSVEVRDDRLLKIGNLARIKLERSMYPRLRNYMPEQLVIGGHSRKRNVGRAGGRENVTEILGDDTIRVPAIIHEDMGYMLPDVEIKDKRIYIDYFTFKALDTYKDTEHERDKGEFTTDVYGYLTEKGYFFDDNPSVADFFYVHDSQNLVDDGIYSSPLDIDVIDVVSINVFDRPVYMRDAIELCPLYKMYVGTHVNPLEMETGRVAGGEEFGAGWDGVNFMSTLEQRVRLIEIVLKDENDRSTRKERMNISRRTTTFLGFSAPYEFYSPKYPRGPVRDEKPDYRRTLYWNPNVVTDADGHAEVEFYNNSYSTHFNVSGAGITASGTPYVLDAEY